MKKPQESVELHPAQSQACEPVAWGVTYYGDLLTDTVTLFQDHAEDDVKDRIKRYGAEGDRKVIPLYTHPPAPSPASQRALVEAGKACYESLAECVVTLKHARTFIAFAGEDAS